MTGIWDGAVTDPRCLCEWIALGYVDEQLVMPILRRTAQQCVMDALELARTVDTGVQRLLHSDVAVFLSGEARLLDDQWVGELTLECNNADQKQVLQKHVYIEGYLHTVNMILRALQCSTDLSALDVIRAVVQDFHSEGGAQHRTWGLAAVRSDAAAELDVAAPTRRVPKEARHPSCSLTQCVPLLQGMLVHLLHGNLPNTRESWVTACAISTADIGAQRYGFKCVLIVHVAKPVDHLIGVSGQMKLAVIEQVTIIARGLLVRPAPILTLTPTPDPEP